MMEELFRKIAANPLIRVNLLSDNFGISLSLVSDGKCDEMARVPSLAQKRSILSLLFRATEAIPINVDNRNDPKVLAIWLLYIKLCNQLEDKTEDEIRSFFKFLKSSKVGSKNALFYAEWARFEAGKGKREKALSILKTGKDQMAEPASLLESHEKEITGVDDNNNNGDDWNSSSNANNGNNYNTSYEDHVQDDKRENFETEKVKSSNSTASLGGGLKRLGFLGVPLRSLGYEEMEEEMEIREESNDNLMEESLSSTINEESEYSDDDPINDDPINDDPINDDPINDDPINDDPINDDPIIDVKNLNPNVNVCEKFNASPPKDDCSISVATAETISTNTTFNTNISESKFTPKPQINEKEKKGKDELIRSDQSTFKSTFPFDKSNISSDNSCNSVLLEPTSNVVSQKSLSLKSFLSKSETVLVNGKPYFLLSLIGRGGSSNVYRVISETGDLCALKRIQLRGIDDQVSQGYHNEISMLKQFKGHPNIIQMIDHEVKEGNEILVLMELGDIDLGRLLHLYRGKRGYESFVSFCWDQMVSAVEAIHERKIVHCDLKPANFVLVQGCWKLIDFGISKAILQDHTSVLRENQVGTVSYMSPEALLSCNNNNGNNGNEQNDTGKPQSLLKINCSADVWSLGCILYEMVFGKSPFAIFPSLVLRLAKICDKNYHIPVPPVAFKSSTPQSNRLVDRFTPVILGCLERDIKNRFTLSQILNK